MRSVGRSLSVLGIAIALTVLAGSSALGAWPKTFTGLKDCGSFPAPPTCLITDSTLKILRGAVVTYTAPSLFVATPFLHVDSDVVLRATDNKRSTAAGHCTFWLAGPMQGNGHCDYMSGTGRLSGFHASIAVGTTAIVQQDGVGFVNSLTGTYWFDRGKGGR